MKDKIFLSLKITILLFFSTFHLHAIIPNGWYLPALQLSDYISNRGMQYGSLSTAIDDSGNGLATWITTTTDNTRAVAVARFENHQWLSTIFTFRETQNIAGFGPKLYMTPTGDAFILWHEGEHGSGQLYIRKFESGTIWTNWATTSTTILITNKAFGIYNMAVNDTGDALILFTEVDGAIYSSHSTFYNHTQEWNTWTPTIIETNVLPMEDNIHMAIDNNGNGLVAYGGEGGYISQYLNMTPTPTWPGSRKDLASEQFALVGFPSLALDPETGYALVVWREDISADTINLQATRYEGQDWDTWAPLTKTLTTTSNAILSGEPAIAINKHGHCSIVWDTLNINSSLATLEASYYDGTDWESWTPPAVTLLDSSPNTRAGYYFKLCVCPSATPTEGNFYALWRINEDTNFFVRASISLGGSWETTQEVCNVGTNEVDTLSLVVDSNGNALAVWGQIAKQGTADPYILTSINNCSWYDIATNKWQNKITSLSDANSLTYFANLCSSMNTSGNVIVAWEYGDVSSDRFVQVTNPIFLNTKPSDNTSLTSATRCTMLMDGKGNAEVITLNGSELVRNSHSIEDETDMWESSTISSNATCFSADINISGNSIVSYIDSTANVYAQYNKGSTSVVDSNGSNVKASISRNNKNTGIVIQKNEITRANNNDTGSITAATYNSETLDWTLSPTLVESGASDPQIRVDNNFNLFVMWKKLYEPTLGLSNIQAIRGQATPLGTWDWSTIVDITPSDSAQHTNASSPRIAVDGSGNAIAIWEYTDDTLTNTVIQSQYYIFNQTWTNLTTLSTTDKSASNATISMDTAGNAIVSWLIPYDNGTEIVTRVQGIYFDTKTKTWQSISLTRTPEATYFSPDNKNASYLSSSSSDNNRVLLAFVLSDTYSSTNNVTINELYPATGQQFLSNDIFATQANYTDVSCATNSTTVNGIASIKNTTLRQDSSTNIEINLSNTQPFSYGLVQWCSTKNKQYIASIKNNSPQLDWYLFDPTQTASLAYLTYLNLESETTQINDLAVYNKNDNELYCAIATQNNVQIQQWNGTSFERKSLLDTTSSGTITKITWWVDTLNPSYKAYIATADQNNNVTIYGLDHSFTFGLIDYITVGEDPLTSLLWLVKTNFDGSIKSLDLIGGSTANNYEYTISVNPTTKTINSFKENTLPYPMGGLSTCDDYLAIGDYGAPEGIGASIRTYKVASDGTLTQTNSVIPDSNATHIYYLAKCCNGNPQYLLAGIGNGTSYSLYVYTQKLNKLIAQASIGTLVNSVAWSPTGTNTFLGVTYQEEQKKAGRIFKLEQEPTPSLVDLGVIAFSL
jgi:hypothetical protein